MFLELCRHQRVPSPSAFSAWLNPALKFSTALAFHAFLPSSHIHFLPSLCTLYTLSPAGRYAATPRPELMNSDMSMMSELRNSELKLELKLELRNSELFSVLHNPLVTGTKN